MALWKFQLFVFPLFLSFFLSFLTFILFSFHSFYSNKAFAYQSSSKSSYLFRLLKIIRPCYETFHRISVDVSIRKSSIKV